MLAGRGLRMNRSERERPATISRKGPPRAFALAAALLFAGLFAGSPARAQQAEDETMAEPGQPSVAPLLPEPFTTWNGLRPALEARGVTFAFTYLSDAMRTLGREGRQGASYMGRAEGIVEADLEKLAGWSGARFHAGAFLTHGAGLTHHFVRNLSNVSDLEAAASPRLNDIWIEQKIGDRASLRVGRLAADSEFFFFAPSASLPVGGAFGWTPLTSHNLPNGGPAYPLAWPGARLRYEATPTLAFQVGVFDGDAIGPGLRSADVRDRAGVRARFASPFMIGEAQLKYRLPAFGGLAGQVRLGAWRHFGKFEDQRFDSAGGFLAAPGNTGAGARRRGDFSFYGVVDQQVWRPADNAADGVFVWARAGVAPSDRNLLDLYVDGGVNFVGLVPGRLSDRFGIAGYYARVSSGARARDLDARLFGTWEAPMRDHEILMEATYAFEVAPGFSLQPHVQYVLHPGGSGRGIDSDGRVKAARAATIGLRTSIKY